MTKSFPNPANSAFSIFWRGHRRSQMENRQYGYYNIIGADRYRMFYKFFERAWKLVTHRYNREVRQKNGLSPCDTLFNFVKLSFLEHTVLRYRNMVRFGDKVIIDSTFPPFPSPAFDRRLSNYLNYFDIQDIPSGIVSISTTNLCPYSCSFCSTNSRRISKADLDEELIINTIKQIEGLGVPMIILHGGEPMYRYDRFLRIVKSVARETCLWMFTTGYGVTLDRALELQENGLFGVWVSLDHFDPEIHNSLRGNPNAYEKARTAVAAFKSAGVYTCLSLVPPDDFIDPANFKKYYDMAKEMGVAEIRIMEKKPSGREASRGVNLHSPVLASMQRELYEDPAYSDYPPISGLSTWLEKDDALGCQCRFEYLFISASGDVQPCEVSEISFGNIKDEPFPDIYERISKAFEHCATGCIPMVMYPEVRNYQQNKNRLNNDQRIELSKSIIEGFRKKGKIPGAYKPFWNIYQYRLETYRKRKIRQVFVDQPY